MEGGSGSAGAYRLDFISWTWLVFAAIFSEYYPDCFPTWIHFCSEITNPKKIGRSPPIPLRRRRHRHSVPQARAPTSQCHRRQRCDAPSAGATSWPTPASFGRHVVPAHRRLPGHQRCRRPGAAAARSVSFTAISRYGESGWSGGSKPFEFKWTRREQVDAEGAGDRVHVPARPGSLR